MKKDLRSVMGMVIILSAMGVSACGPGAPTPQLGVSEAWVPTETLTATPVLSPALSAVEGEVEGPVLQFPPYFKPLHRLRPAPRGAPRSRQSVEP